MNAEAGEASFARVSLIFLFPVFEHGSRLRNDLYCVEWGVKLYSLTHSLEHGSFNSGALSTKGGAFMGHFSICFSAAERKFEPVAFSPALVSDVQRSLCRVRPRGVGA